MLELIGQGSPAFTCDVSECSGGRWKHHVINAPGGNRAKTSVQFYWDSALQPYRQDKRITRGENIRNLRDYDDL